MRYADGKYREKEYTAYVHITPSKKRYVGITSQVPRCRWNEGEGYKSQKLFYRAIQKYGWKNIQHIIIAEHLTLSEASDLEKSLIDKFKSNQKEFGYNLTDGGEGLSGYRLTDEQKEKCRQSSTGRHHTQATKDKISKINKGRKLNLTDEQRHICAERAKKLPHYKKTAEQRQRMSEAYEKRRDRPAHTTPHSEETKRKISEAAKNRKPISEETRRKLSEAAKKQWKRQKQMKKEKSSMRFSYEDADKYGGGSGGKTNFFSLKNDGDKAYVHILGNDMNDFPGYAVHRVPIGDGYRYVNCLREAGAPVTDCPFCAEGKHSPEISKVYAKLFIPLYDCDDDTVKIWERGKTFFRDLASYCSHNPNVSEIVTEIERRGKAGDTSTTYGLYATRETDNFAMENVAEDIPNVLGDIVLDKTKSDMEVYLKRGQFPDDSSSDEGIARRGSSRDEEPPFREGNERRTPSSRRGRTAEDEY